MPQLSRRNVLRSLGAAITVPLLQADDPSVSVYDDSEAYRIYSMLMREQLGDRKQVVIKAETVSRDMCLEPDKNSAAKLNPAIESYKQRNKQQYRLQEGFDLPVPYVFMDETESRTIFSVGPDWTEFYKRYPHSGGYFDVTVVGFNPDRTVAVLQLGHMCGGLCGGGSFSVLQKLERDWKPMKWNGSFCVWAS